MKLWDRKKRHGYRYGKVKITIPQQFRCALFEVFGPMCIRKLFYFGTMQEAYNFGIKNEEEFQIFDRKFKRIIHINRSNTQS